MLLQAPSGGDIQGWSWVAVEDSAIKPQIADLYRKFHASYREHRVSETKHATANEARMQKSGDHLAENLHRVPWLVIPCITGPMGRADVGMGTFAQAMTWASIYPSIWSFQLALRSTGLASCITTNHLAFEREIAELLGIPYETTNQAALLPVAYSIGANFRAAARKPVTEVLHRDHWSAR